MANKIQVTLTVEQAASVCDALDALMRKAKCLLGHPGNGSYGILRPHIAMSGRRSYKIKKVIEKTLAVHRDPSPEIKGVNYDGLCFRVTTDPEPVAVVIEE